MSIQIADQVKQVGVNVKLQRITGSDMRARSAPGKQDIPFFTFEDGPIVLDPIYTMSLLAQSTGVSNRAHYNNPELDALINRAKESLDKPARDHMARQAQKIWMDDAPWIVTVYPTTFESMSPTISGWVPHPDEHERWVDLHLG